MSVEKADQKDDHEYKCYMSKTLRYCTTMVIACSFFVTAYMTVPRFGVVLLYFPFCLLPQIPSWSMQKNTIYLMVHIDRYYTQTGCFKYHSMEGVNDNK